MSEERFETNLLRTISAELFFLCGMQTAREMFGKGYFSLGVQEKATVDQTVLSFVGSNYAAATPELLMAQQAKPAVGFQGSGQTDSSQSPGKEKG